MVNQSLLMSAQISFDFDYNFYRNSSQIKYQQGRTWQHQRIGEDKNSWLAFLILLFLPWLFLKLLGCKNGPQVLSTIALSSLITSL